MAPEEASMLDMLDVAHQRVADAIDTRRQVVVSLLEQGFTSRQLAARIGVSHPTILNWAEAAR